MGLILQATPSPYFDLLEETVAANGLEGKQGQIFNMDAIGVLWTLQLLRLCIEKEVVSVQLEHETSHRLLWLAV